MVSTPITVLSVPKHTLQPHGVCSTISWMRKRRLGPASNAMSTAQKWTATTPFLRQAWMISVKGHHIVIQFVWKEKWPDVNCLWFMGCIQWICWMVRDLEKARLQNLWQRHLGKESVNRSLQIGKDVKMLLPHVNDLRTVTLAEEDFSHQVRRTVSLFP